MSQPARSQDDPLDRVFHALSDPSRRRFLERVRLGPASVSELADLVDISLPAVSRHVRVLADAGLITRVKRGRVTWCEPVPAGLQGAERFIAQQRSAWDDRLDRLAQLVESPHVP